MRPRVGDLRFIPGLMIGVVFVWGGTRVAAASVPVALLMIAIGAVTLVLVVRMMLGDRAAGNRIEATGELTTPNLDYLVWAAFLVPMLMIVALLILAVTGSLSNG
jgi:hypothetical protein